jgi:hypothetical protein
LDVVRRQEPEGFLSRADVKKFTLEHNDWMVELDIHHLSSVKSPTFEMLVNKVLHSGA